MDKYRSGLTRKPFVTRIAKNTPGFKNGTKVLITKGKYAGRSGILQDLAGQWVVLIGVKDSWVLRGAPSASSLTIV